VSTRTRRDAPTYIVLLELGLCRLRPLKLCDYCYYYNNRQDASPDDSSQVSSLLMPTSLPSTRARIRLLNDHYDTCSCGTRAIHLQYLMNKGPPAKDAELENALHTALDVYEEALEKTRSCTSGGPYFMGDAFTLADAHVVPFVLRLIVSLRHFKGGYEVLPRDRFPRLLQQWYSACAARPSVRAVTPSDEQTIIEVYRKFVERDYSFGGLNQNT